MLGGAKDISSAHAGDSQPSWSPHGKRLAFANLSRSGRPAIYWMFADGSFRPGFGNPDAGTRDVDASAPAWSPDGQWIAFESWRNGASHDIYRMTVSGGQVTPLTNDAELDYQPAWRP